MGTTIRWRWWLEALQLFSLLAGFPGGTPACGFSPSSYSQFACGLRAHEDFFAPVSGTSLTSSSELTWH